MNKAAVTEFHKTYGPYAFGVTSLVVLWFAIMKPELDRNRVDYDAQLETVRAMDAMATTMQATANTLERTVQELKRQ